MKKAFYIVLYKLTGHLFPDSYATLRLGNKSIRLKTGFKYRGFLARHIIRECGKDVNIERHAVFNRDIHLGDYSGIGLHSLVSRQTFIGNHVMMGPEVMIYTSNHLTERTDITMDQQGFRDIQPVHIGNDVWIGARAIVLPGVTIGDGCVIGAGAVVSKDIPPYSIAVGNPARVVKNRKLTRVDNVLQEV